MNNKTKGLLYMIPFTLLVLSIFSIVYIEEIIINVILLSGIVTGTMFVVFGIFYMATLFIRGIDLLYK